MRLVAEPINTSPLAPTYSGADDVDMVRVAVMVRFHVLAFSPSVTALTPTFSSFLLSTLLSIPKPNVPVSVFISTPNLVEVSTSLSEVHTPPLLVDLDVTLPLVHSALEPVPGGSRRIISTTSGPLVTKLLPVGSEPRMMPFMPLPSQL